jgi:hypothetical protein
MDRIKKQADKQPLIAVFSKEQQMGRVLTVTGRLADTPYRIRKIERNVYSAEELCYSLAQCADFMDEEIMDPELAESPIVYPDQSVLDNGTSFAFLPESVSRYMESLFMKVRNS